MLVLVAIGYLVLTGALLSALAPLAFLTVLALLVVVQPLGVPALYFQGLSAENATLLLLTKDFLVVGAAAFALVTRLPAIVGSPSVLLALAFAAMTTFRSVLDTTSWGSEAAWSGVRQILVICALFLVAWDLGSRVDWRRILSICAAISGVAIAFSVLLHATTDEYWWRERLNLAEFAIDVRGYSWEAVAAEFGLPANVLQREVVIVYFAHRLFGLFGDPLAFGMNSAAVFVLALAGFPRRGRVLLGAIAAFGLLFSFSRSAWVTAAVAVLFVRRDRIWLFAVAAVLGVDLLTLLVPGIDLFVSGSIKALTSMDLRDHHAAGIVGFYTTALSDARNILGKGWGFRDIPESGYAWLVEQLGIIVSLFFLGWLAQLVRNGVSSWREGELEGALVVGFATATLVNMHFAEYALSFTSYWLIWIVLGALAGSWDRRRAAAALGPRPRAVAWSV